MRKRYTVRHGSPRTIASEPFAGFAHSIDQANAERKGRRMTKSIWTIEQFACPGCGIDYSATREEHRDKRSGSYNCSICETEVHRWSGTHEYFNWQAAQTRSRVFGRKR
jgi:predicted RNA-binding Zn-ribbon protein involved in translation (DUF1610 family)